MTAILAVAILKGANQIRSEPMSNGIRPSHDELASCGDENQIVAVGGAHKGTMTFLKFAFRTGDTELVCLDESAARHLVAVLKSLVPKHEAIDALSIFVEPESGIVFASS